MWKIFSRWPRRFTEKSRASPPRGATHPSGSALFHHSPASDQLSALRHTSHVLLPAAAEVSASGSGG